MTDTINLTRALCRTELWPEAWFAEDSATAATAIAVCERCPEKTPCLDGALARGDVGIWGGVRITVGRMRRSGRTPEHTLVLQALADRAWHPRDEVIARVAADLPPDRRAELATCRDAAKRGPGGAVRAAVTRKVAYFVRYGRVECRDGMIRRRA